MKPGKILSFLLLFITTALFSQGPVVPAQLSDLIKKAMENYPRLKAGNEMVSLNQTQGDLTKTAYYPYVSGDATYRYAKPTPVLSLPLNGQEYSFAFFPANNYDLHVGLNETIYDFGRTQASVKKTLTQLQTSKDQLESDKSALAYQVAQFYYGIVFTNKEIDIQNDQIKLYQENEKIVSDRIKDGDALKYDLLSTQVKESNAQNNLVDLQDMLAKRYQMLNMFTAMQGDGYITARDVDPEEVGNTEVTADNNLDIIAQTDQLKSYDWDIKSQNRNLLPSLTGHAQLGWQNGFIPNVNTILFAYSAGVGINIPIFTPSSLGYASKIAKINRQAADYNLQTQKLTVNTNILQTKSDIAASENKLKNYQTQVDQAEEALHLANIRFKAGVITNLEFLTSQTDLEEAKLGQVQLEYNLLLSRLSLNQLGGVKIW